MAATKPTFYLYIILIVVVLGVALMDFGIDMAIKKELTNSSIIYIDSYAGFAISSGVVTLSEIPHVTTEGKEILAQENETGQSTIENNLAVVNYYASRTQPSVNYYKLTYNLPTFIVLSFGLDVTNFAILINALGVIIFMSLIMVLFKVVRG